MTETMMGRWISLPERYRRRTQALMQGLMHGQRLTEIAESRWTPVNPPYMSSRPWQLPVST